MDNAILTKSAKKALIAFLFISAANLAYAEWVEVLEYSGMITYVDPSSIRKLDDGTMEIKQLWNYQSPLSAKGKAATDERKIWSQTGLGQYKCNISQTRVINRVGCTE